MSRNTFFPWVPCHHLHPLPPTFLGSFWSFFPCYCFLLNHPNRKFTKHIWPTSSDSNKEPGFVQRLPLAHSSSSSVQGGAPHFWRWMGWQLCCDTLLREGVQEPLWDRSFGMTVVSAHSHLGWGGVVAPVWAPVVWWGTWYCEGWMLSPFSGSLRSATLQVLPSFYRKWVLQRLAVTCKHGAVSLLLGVLSLDRVLVWNHRGSVDFFIFVVFEVGYICHAGGDCVLQKSEVNESSCSLEGLPKSIS